MTTSVSAAAEGVQSGTFSLRSTSHGVCNLPHSSSIMPEKIPGYWGMREVHWGHIQYWTKDLSHRSFLYTVFAMQKRSLYNSNKLVSQYLLWPDLFFNTGWTLLGKRSFNFFGHLREFFSTPLKRNSRLFFVCWLSFVLFSLKITPTLLQHC